MKYVVRGATVAVVLLVMLFYACAKKESVTDSRETVALHEEEELIAVFGDTVAVIETEIRRGEGPFNVLERLLSTATPVNIDGNIRQKILWALANEADLNVLRVGERFAGVFNQDTTRFLEFVYYQDQVTTHRILISDEGEVEYQLDEKPLTVKHRLIRGTLELPTLDAQLKADGLSPRIAGIVTNVLECKVSFRTDARIGDEYEVLLEETHFDDGIIDGRTLVLYVSYNGVRAGTHSGYRYFDGDRSSYNAHYTKDGEALIFSGLRFPLDRIHITSSYGMRRHPVTGKRAMHSGVDYRASVGTPVYAVAEGRVTKSTSDKLSGNYIAIRHKDGYSSYYLHLSRRSVAVGAQVRARQLIGYSGNTGLSSGPHLHFGFKQPNGSWMNPTQKRMIATPKLSGEKLEKLKSQIASIKEIYESHK